MEHITPKRLFELSQTDETRMKSQLETRELEHLRECSQCQQILAVLARQFDEARPPHDHPSET